MSKYLINGESIEAIADGFRTSRGTEQKYTLDEMAVLAAEKVGGGAGGSMFEIGGASRGAKPLLGYNGNGAFLNLESISISGSFVSVE